MRRVWPTFVECHSHWFKLVVCDLFNDHEDLLEKGQALMRKLSYQISAARLRRLTPLKAKVNNKKGWRTTFGMLKRYLEINNFVGLTDIGVVQAPVLTSEEDEEGAWLMKTLGNLDSITKKLQDPAVSLPDART